MAVLVVGAPDVERVVILVEPALHRPGGDVAARRVHPGQVAVPGRHQDVVLLLSTYRIICIYLVSLHQAFFQIFGQYRSVQNYWASFKKRLG